MPSPSIRIDASDVDHLLKELGMAGPRLQRAAVAAINRVGDQAFTQVRREMAKVTGIPQRKLEEGSRGLKRYRASTRRLSYDIVASGRFIPLAYFAPVQRRGGVSARPWGIRKTFRGTFLARMPGGHVGVFKRTGPRPGKGKPAPIEELWGPSLPRELLRGSLPTTFHSTFEQRLPARLLHEVNRVLNGIGAR